MHMITKNDWCTFTVYDYLVLLSLTHHINIESNNQNLTKEIWLFSGFRPFPSIILKYGILSWLMKEKRTFVNGNCIGSWATYSSIHFHGHSPNPQGQLRWRLTNALWNELLEKRIYVCNNWGKGWYCMTIMWWVTIRIMSQLFISKLRNFYEFCILIDMHKIWNC